LLNRLFESPHGNGPDLARGRERGLRDDSRGALPVSRWGRERWRFATWQRAPQLRVESDHRQRALIIGERLGQIAGFFAQLPSAERLVVVRVGSHGFDEMLLRGFFIAGFFKQPASSILGTAESDCGRPGL